jgi:hypothetical protein
MYLQHVINHVLKPVCNCLTTAADAEARNLGWVMTWLQGPGANKAKCVDSGAIPGGCPVGGTALL